MSPVAENHKALSRHVFSDKSVRNIAAHMFDAANRFEDSPAVGMAGSNDPLVYRQFAEKVAACALSLKSVAPREPVGLLSENRPEWGIAYFAILAAGGVVVPIDTQLKELELEHIFCKSGIKRLFVSARHRATAQIAAANISLDLLDLERLLTPAPSNSLPACPGDSDSPAVIIFTSGTSGKAKKVVLTHGNIMGDIDGVIRRLSFGPGDRFLSVLPLHHTFEATCGLIVPLLSGCSVYYVKELNSREILDGIKKHRVTHFISVPLLYEKIYHGILNAVKKAPPTRRALFNLTFAAVKGLHAVSGWNLGGKAFASFRRKAGLDSLRLMVSGAAPLPIEISKNYRLLGFNFVEGYGMTEASPVLSVNPSERVKFGSVGPVLDNVEIRIEGPDDRGIGEIVVRGPMVMRGYDGNPEETSKVIKDGWLYTGDMGRLDRDGYLYILGRKKGVIVSAAGKNIYPEEIEAALLKSPYILETLVQGTKAERGREEVAALIYPDLESIAAEVNIGPADLSDADIKKIIDPEVRRIGSSLADYKRVKHITIVRHELEKTSSRKIKRQQRT